MGKLYVIGIGYKAFEKKVEKILLDANVVFASERLFEIFKNYKEFEDVKDKVVVINNIDETFHRIKEMLPKGDVVLLASGDPMFFGIGRRAVTELGKDVIEIIPDLSSIQLAFARIKEPWDDAFFVNLHRGPDPKKVRKLPYGVRDIPLLLKRYPKIAILTDSENNPSVIAKEIPSRGLKIYVCEKLGYTDEKITTGSADEIAGMSFSEPNLVIILSE